MSVVVEFPGPDERARRLAARHSVEDDAAEAAVQLMNTEAGVVKAALGFLDWADQTPDLAALPECALLLLDCAERLRRCYCEQDPRD